MHQAGDHSVNDLSENYFHSMKRRQDWTRKSSLFSPSLSVNFMLTSLAHTGLSTQLVYLDNVRRFHETMKEFFYPLIFNEHNFNDEDYSRLPHYNFDAELNGVAIARSTTLIMLITILFLIIGLSIFYFSRYHHF